jgi:hypothetical protein
MIEPAMLETLGTVLAYVIAMALVAAPIWWAAALWRRRCAAAARRAAAELDGRYEPAGSRRFSGGTVYGRRDGRDVVVDFFTGQSHKSSHTAALTTLKRARDGRLLVRRKLLAGWDGAGALPPGGAPLLRRLDAFWYPRVEAWSNMLSVRVWGVLHDGGRIVELASIAAALASELERPSPAAPLHRDGAGP